MDPLTPAHRGPTIAPPASVTIVERPDPTGERWAQALAILLEAGQSAEEAHPA